MATPTPDPAARDLKVEALTQPRPAPTHADPTFTSYTTTQSAAYAASRRPYPDPLIQLILNQHTGPSRTLLDVGCGPGTATRSLAQFFNTAFGTDPSPSMVETANSISSYTASAQAVRYAVAAADTSLLDVAGLKPGSVDMITVAMAAHWFDLPVFYAVAATLLRPGGTLAMWTSSSLYCHPHTTSRATEVQDILFRLEHEYLLPYEMPGNLLSREMYNKLPLPWQVEPKVRAFHESGFQRWEWNRDGKVEAGEGLFHGGMHETLEELAESLGTASMVTRWREANGEGLRSGSLEDCVGKTVRKIRAVLGEGVGLELGSATVLLVFKKERQAGL